METLGKVGNNELVFIGFEMKVLDSGDLFGYFMLRYGGCDENEVLPEQILFHLTEEYELESHDSFMSALERLVTTAERRLIRTNHNNKMLMVELAKLKQDCVRYNASKAPQLVDIS